jgi:hypothetical protein
LSVFLPTFETNQKSKSKCIFKLIKIVFKLIKKGCKSAGESAAFTMGDRNVCTGTRQKLANKPYLDHMICSNGVKIDDKSMTNR